MKIETIPMRTVTYFGTKIQIPAHHTAIAVDASGMVHSFEAAPKLDVNVWKATKISLNNVHLLDCRMTFDKSGEWRDSLQIYPLDYAVQANAVTEADLQGEIAGFHLHVVQTMCDEQVRQGRPFNPSVFSAHKIASKREGGFNWADTEKGRDKGRDFWHEIIHCRNFDLIPSPKAHPHAGLMMKYAEIAQTTDKPWEHFEVRRNKSAVWEAIYAPMPFYGNMEYRLKPEPPKTIRIGEYDVPEPVREPLEDDKEYWGVDPMAEEFAWNYKWHNAAFCNLRLRRGLIHLTKEAAVIHAKALLSLTKAAD